jgi:two-component system cell cycle sensor histidine kinase/response regulator CckA
MKGKPPGRKKKQGRRAAGRAAETAVPTARGPGASLEHALLESDAGLRSFIDNAVFGIYRSALGGRILLVNRTLAAMLGYGRPEELLGRDLATAVYRDPAERRRLVQRHTRRDHFEGVETVWKRKDGRPVPVRLSGRVLRDEAGRVGGFEGIVEDLTERHGLEQRLRLAQKMEAVGQLAGGMAHDFNNLLTTILTTTELITADLPPASPIRNDLAAIAAASRRGSDLIRKLLGFARRQRLDLQPVGLAPILEAAAASLRRLLPPAIEVRLAVDEGAGAVRADPAAVEQILISLATNARDAMPGGGTLTITASRTRLTAEQCMVQGWGEPGAYVVVSVADGGVGMDPDTLDHLFEPFFTTKPVGAGTGLGLAMVYGLVQQHDGFVDVQSSIGEGTTVRILLPVAEPAAPRRAPGAGSARLGGTELILLAEDEEALRRAAARVLAKHGYRVLEAANGAEALAHARARRGEIALIVADVVMPSLGGPQLARLLRAEGDPVRILFTSGYTARDVQETKALDPGMPFLAKPWAIADLLRRVREVLDRPDRE